VFFVVLKYNEFFVTYLGLNIYLIPIFVVYVQFGHHFRFTFNYVLILIKFWSIWSF